MAKNRTRRRAPAAPAVSLGVLTADMQRHVADLGLDSLDGYLAWCRRNGFSLGLNKPGALRSRELERSRAVRGDRELRAAVRVRNPAHAVRLLLAGATFVGDAFRELAAALRDEAEPRRMLLAQVLRHLAAVAPDALAPAALGQRVALHAAAHHEAVLRPADTFVPRTHNERRMLASLVQHLFARFDAPACLLDGWFGNGDAAARHRRWWLHVVAGGSLRTAPELPFALTKRMAHECAAAPAELSPQQMLRWAQVRALGGSERLARAIVASRLGGELGADAVAAGSGPRNPGEDPTPLQRLQPRPCAATWRFWETFVQWCVRHGVDDAGEVASFVDYVHEHRHGGGVAVDERGRRTELPALQPNLTMTGRTPESLRRQVDAWHGRLGRGGEQVAALRWPASGWPGYRATVDAGRPTQVTWSVRELCTGRELQRESARMRNCVASYAARCAFGAVRIFSLTREQPGGSEPAATIEVRNGEVVQARAIANRALGDAAREHLRRWVQAAGLTIARWV